jgi:hypothetical protein
MIVWGDGEDIIAPFCVRRRTLASFLIHGEILFHPEETDFLTDTTHDVGSIESIETDLLGILSASNTFKTHFQRIEGFCEMW